MKGFITNSFCFHNNTLTVNYNPCMWHGVFIYE